MLLALLVTFWKHHPPVVITTINTDSGVTKTTTQVVGEQAQTVSNQKQTVARKPLHIKIGNRDIFFEYNERGEVVSTTDGVVKVEVYDIINISPFKICFTKLSGVVEVA